MSKKKTRAQRKRKQSGAGRPAPAQRQTSAAGGSDLPFNQEDFNQEDVVESSTTEPADVASSEPASTVRSNVPVSDAPFDQESDAVGALHLRSKPRDSESAAGAEPEPGASDDIPSDGIESDDVERMDVVEGTDAGDATPSANLDSEHDSAHSSRRDRAADVSGEPPNAETTDAAGNSATPQDDTAAEHSAAKPAATEPAAAVDEYERAPAASVSDTPARAPQGDSVSNDTAPAAAADPANEPSADAEAFVHDQQPTTPGTKKSPAWKVLVPVVALTAGAVFGVSARASNGTDLRPGETNLADVVSRADHRVQDKQKRVAAMRSEVEALNKTSTKQADANTVLRLNKKADAQSDPAGLSTISGPSISVTLDDSKRGVESLPEDGTPDWLVVHQQDVQGVVNALWRGGARGMMLMDQRVVSTSAVRCVGNTLILQGRVYSPPFTIRAIGDPVKLRAALDNDESVKIYRQYVDLVGLGYDVKTNDHDTFGPFTGSVAMKHAKVKR